MIFLGRIHKKRKKQRELSYRKSVIQGIDMARRGRLSGDASKTSGLRCIRDFERANNVKFNIKNPSHKNRVYGRGHLRELIRHLDLINRRE